MTKHDLKARPVFHHQKDAIDAHLSVVFAALAIGQHLKELTGLSLKKIIIQLEALRSAKIEINGVEVIIPTQVPYHLKLLMERLRDTN